MNEVTIFSNEEFGSVRTILIDGEPWFVGNDVARALGYVKPQNAIKDNVDKDDTLKKGVMDSLGREQQSTIINESGLYSLIFSSKLPSATRFKKWVTSEVLPSIRKNGGYIKGQENMTPEQIVANALVVANNIIQEQNKKIESMQPKSDYFDTLVDSNLLTNFRDTEKELGYRQKEFTSWLELKGYIYRDSKGIIKPYSQHINNGLFAMKDFSNPRSGYSGVRTYVTVKGKNTFRLLMQMPDEMVISEVAE